MCLETHKPTKEELIADARLYIEHIESGKGDALVMVKKIILDIQNKRFCWSDIKITPEELADRIDRVANDTLVMIEKKTAEFVSDYSGIIDFLDSKAGT